MENDPPSECWVLLIGIDLYPDDVATVPLEGCVRDVEAYESLLTNQPNYRIIALKASRGNLTDPTKPREPENQWPTLSQVRAKLRLILENARPQASVHIHFSGHGIRRKTQSEDFGDHEYGDLALALYDPVSDVSYLQGYELATALGQMVAKKLHPVLVLDCCHSGAVLRDGEFSKSNIREAVYDPEIDRRSTLWNLRSLDAILTRTPRRDTELLPDWFLDPDGYDILTACGPREKSREVQHKSGHNGALTHVLIPVVQWMLQRKYELSLQKIYEYVVVRFHAGFVTQCPRRYGNPRACLFKALQLSHNALETRVFWQDGVLFLDDGEAGGVVESDEYLLRRDGPTEDAGVSRICARVEKVFAFRAALQVLDPHVDVSSIKTAWCAYPCTHLSRRVASSIELSSRLTDPAWHDDIEKAGFLRLRSPGEPVQSHLSLFVDLTNEGQYKICAWDGAEIPGLPTVAAASEFAIRKTINMLDHLVRFKYIEALETRIPDLDFESNIRIQLATPSGELVNECGVLHVPHGQQLLLRCFNLSPVKAAYVSVLNLTPLKKVHLAIRKKGDYSDVQQYSERGLRTISETKPMKLRMKIPDELLIHGKCEDVIKVFVTSEPHSLTSLELPPISTCIEERATTRSGHDLFSAVLDLFSPRHRSHAGSWMTRNFIVHTST